MNPLSTPLCLAGELTIYRATEWRSCLQAALAGLAEGAALDIDLSAVTEMDSAGVQLLMAARKSAQAAGGALRLVGHSAAVREVFAAMDLDGFFADALPPAALAH